MRFLTYAHVAITADGFTVTAGNGDCTVVRWTAVSLVATYKLDLLTIDEVMLAFEIDDRPAVEVGETLDGFDTLAERMESELGIRHGWFGEVVRPAFATNYRVLYERGAQITSPQY